MTDETRVDLGEDLLEKTQQVELDISSGIESINESKFKEVDDLLQTADILQGEGLFEDAKKILRRILRAHPGQHAATHKLEEIQKKELHQILEETPSRGNLNKVEDGHFSEINADEVMQNLDRDLSLGVCAVATTLFPSKAQMESFAYKLDGDLRAFSSRDRMDIGIAFLEMSLFDLAIRQFRAAARDQLWLVASSSLLAYSLILSDRPFEAVLTLEPLLEDSELKQEEKTDLMYLMARAYERLQKKSMARRWYEQVLLMQRDYRDVEHRLRFLEKC